jgi:hypothetical protein
MKKIKLTQGQFALVDDEQFEELNKVSWYAHRGHRGTGKLCAVRNNWKKGVNYPLKMHRVIMGNPVGFQVDHINGNDLDNIKINLRLCQNFQNNCNKGKQKNNTSGYKGVYRHRKSWTAYIHKCKRKIHIGSFENIVDAAKAYDKMAIKLHGEFAKLNF